MPVNPLEHLAQKQFKYTKLFEDQAAILRKDPVVYQSAYDSVLNSEGIAKAGQPWMPKADEKDAYMRYLVSWNRKLLMSGFHQNALVVLHSRNKFT